MYVFFGKCPHCGSEKGFQAFGLGAYTIKVPSYPPDSRLSPQNRLAREQKSPVWFSLAGDCLKCFTPVVATCEAILEKRNEIEKCITDPNRLTTYEVKVLEIFPSPTPPYAHPSLPEPVRNAFVDLQVMVQQQMQPFIIIGGCRAVLERAVKVLGGEGNALYDRIRDLRAKGIITASLEEWATIVRKAGNAAMHEMQGTHEQAEELVNFTKVFLQFTFELPATIVAYRRTE